MNRAVVLTGGKGMRLRPYTTVLPKPLMPIGDRPILDIVVRQLQRHGFERITMATGHLAELIEVFFRDGEAYGVAIDYYREDEPLGTVGALAMLDDLDGDVLVMNGDILTDLDYGAFLDDHRSSGAAASIATTLQHVTISLGVLECDDPADPEKLTNYREKPAIDYQASMGIYCFSPTGLAHIEHGERLDFPDLVLRLLAAGERVRAVKTDCYWLDIGRPSDYEQASEEFERFRDRLLPGG
jgi:NDP-mannose synthase